MMAYSATLLLHFFAQIRKKKSVAYNSAARAPTIILIAFVNVVIFALSTLTNRA